MGRTTAALTRLLAAQGQRIEDTVRDMHEAVADRVFDTLGPVAAPVRAVHDRVGGTVHLLVREALGAAGAAGAQLLETVDDDVLADSPAGRATVGAILGLIGSSMADSEPDLDWPTTLLSADGQTVAVTGGARPAPLRTRTVIVLLHGLCETEQAWGWGTGPTRPSVPDRLAGPDRTILLARVNSGRRPAEVGRELAFLLASLDSAHVERFVLVGHSMGGLVGRAALRAAVRQGDGWVERCDTLITLGTPHLGAPLEQAVAVMVRAGALAREVDAITSWFDQRGDGVRDLRHGTITDDVAPGQPTATIPLPSHVALHTVSGGLRHRAAAGAFGDGMVRRASAHAIGAADLAQRRGPMLHQAGRGHLDLLADPEIGEHVARLVAAPTA